METSSLHERSTPRGPSRLLQAAVIDDPDSCQLVADLVKTITKSKDAQKRLGAVTQLRECLGHVAEERGQQCKAFLDWVVFLLGRGIMREAKAGLREAAGGDFGVRTMRMKDVSLCSTADSDTLVIKVISYVGLIVEFAADSRCVAFMLKEFPDLVKTLKAIFRQRPMDRQALLLATAGYPISRELRKGVLLALMGTGAISGAVLKQIQRDTKFILEMMEHASSCIATSGDGADEVSVGAPLLSIHNILLLKNADLDAWGTDVLKLIENVLSYVNSKTNIVLAARILRLLTLQSGLVGASQKLASGFTSLRSSVLAMVALKEKIDNEVWTSAFAAAQQIWKEDLTQHPAIKPAAYLESLFKQDQGAVTRAVRLCRVLSGASEVACELAYTACPGRKPQPHVYKESGWGGLDASYSPRLECRKCSR